MSNVSDQRAREAHALATTASNWTTTTAYNIPSRSRPITYLTTATSCTCRSFVASGYRTACVHMLAVRELEAVVAGPCDDLTLERLPSGNFAWLRPEAGSRP